MDNVFLILFTILNAGGILLYGWLILILIDVVICKDAKEIDTQKLFTRSISMRLKLFKRSLGNNFYKGSLALLLGCILVIFIRLSDFSAGVLQLPSVRAVATILIPGGLILVYSFLGYRSPFFRKH